MDGCTIAIVGDLKYGRTVHSLMKLLSLADNITFKMFSPPSLELPVEVEKYARERGHRVIDCDAVPEALVGADVVYATRVQRERMTEEVLVTANVSGNLLNKRLLAEADASDIIIMHPLPRDSRMDSFDLSSDVDDLPGLSIFRQTDNGVLDPDGDLPHHTRLLGGRGEGDHQAAPLGRHPALELSSAEGAGSQRLALVMASHRPLR